MTERDEILAKARRGEISTASAERWAAERGEQFSTKPASALFDPLAAPDWNLSMAAAWILDRSSDAVREQWDRYRGECLIWEPCEDLGFQLSNIGPAKLFDVLGDEVWAAEELLFALKSGQLRSTGVRLSVQTRLPISKSAWRGPFSQKSGASWEDAICAVNHDDVATNDDLDVPVYHEVIVARDGVTGIWVPPTPPSNSPMSARDHRLSVKLLATLPPGFDRADWTVEHVLAWLTFRDLVLLRSLEFANPQRPHWYGHLCRKGYIDYSAELTLRNALIEERVRAIKGENRTIPGGQWRKKSFFDVAGIWFRKDQILQEWPDQRNQPPRSSRREPVLRPKSTLGTLEPERVREGQSSPNEVEAVIDVRKAARASSERVNAAQIPVPLLDIAVDTEPIAVPIAAACRILGVGRTTMFGLIRAGKVESTTIGRRRLVIVASLQALISRKRDHD